MKTHIMFIFDRSGSMEQVRDTVISGYNEFVQSQQKLATPECPISMSLTFFDTTVERVFSGVPIGDVKPLTRTTYRPNGMTALYDAVYDTIMAHPLTEIGAYVTGVSNLYVDRVLCVIQTDGQENASRRHNQRDVADLIKARTNMGNWSFVFLGANQDAWAIAQRLNIPQGNTMSYVGDATGTQAMFASTRESARAYTQSAHRATTSFFTDLSGLNKNDVRNALVDHRHDVKVWTVPKETEIKTFIEFQSGKPYVPGTVYYQLTKTETVQPYKDVALMEKGDKSIYMGPQARAIAGIPTGIDCRLKPGNHANWDLFVQSHSVNRRLVRGTKVLYKESA